MPEDPLHAPHDKLFKRGFGQPETAAAFLRAYLPERLRRHLALDGLELMPGSFIDEHFRAHESDLLYRIPLAGAGERNLLVYCLFEHQSSADRWIAQRLHSYSARIWEWFRRREPQARFLPPIVPVVLVQQPEGWRQETNLGCLFDFTPEQRADFARVVPDFHFVLIELAGLAFEQIVGTPMGVMTLRALKAHPLKALLGPEVWEEELIERLSPEDQRTIIRYILALADVDRAAFAHRVGQLRGAELRRDAMTLAEQFIKEGRDEGREEGLGKGVLIGRIQALENRLGRPETSVSELVGRTLEELQAIQDALQRAAR